MDIIPIIKDEENQTSNNNNLTPKQLAIYAIGAAIIIALFTFVTIKLINKKKKESNLETNTVDNKSNNNENIQ